MSLNSLRLLRNILLRSAVICYGLVALMALFTVGLWDFWSGLTSQWYHTPPETLGPLMVNFFAVAKFYAIFLLLAPGLAIHWTLKKEESRKPE